MSHYESNLAEDSGKMRFPPGAQPYFDSRLLDPRESSAHHLAMEIARPFKAFDLHHPLPSGPTRPKPLDPPSRGHWMVGLLFQMVALRLPGLRSHSRPEEVGLSRQNRMRCRPRENFVGPTGRKKEKQEHFLAAPVDPSRQRYSGRGEQTARARFQMKQSRSAKQLLSTFRRFMADGMVDASVVGAALQRCGHGRWWDALLQVLDLQEKSRIVLDFVGHSLLLNAMGSCLTCHNCTDLEKDARKQRALKIAKRIWGQASPSTSLKLNCFLGPALKLCLRIGCNEAFAWADEVWCSSEENKCFRTFQKDIMSYTAWLSLLELQGKHDDVDNLLFELGEGAKQHLTLNEVTLGDLISRAKTAATSLCDTKRVDLIWQTLVGRYKVKPHFLAYTTYAQTHLLAGHPQNTLMILDDMLQNQKGPKDERLAMDYRLAVLYMQALLIVCHSSMSRADSARLQAFLPKGAAIVEKKSAKGGKAEWKKMEALARKLLSNGKKPFFKELLVNDVARDSHMKSWKNHRAGTKYLPETKFEI